MPIKHHQLLWETVSHTAITVQRLHVHKYPPLRKTRYSFVDLSELMQGGVRNLSPGVYLSNHLATTSKMDVRRSKEHMVFWERRDEWRKTLQRVKYIPTSIRPCCSKSLRATASSFLTAVVNSLLHCTIGACNNHPTHHICR